MTSSGQVFFIYNTVGKFNYILIIIMDKSNLPLKDEIMYTELKKKLLSKDIKRKEKKETQIKSLSRCKTLYINDIQITYRYVFCM